MTENQELKLSHRHQMFAEKYLQLNFNLSAAALAAGYDSKNYRITASRLLSSANVQAYLEKRKQEIIEAAGVNQMRILKELAAIAFADVRDYYDEGNAMKDIKELSDSAAAAIMCVEVFEVYNIKGERIGDTKRIRFQDKLKALEMLGRYLNMFERDNKSKTPELNIYEVTLNLK